MRKKPVLKDKPCGGCGAIFTPGGSRALYCSDECKAIAVKVNHKTYREAHKEKIAARDKAHREAHPEKYAARNKAYYEANKVEHAARNKAYREANPGKEAARKNAYNEAHPGAALIRVRRRRACKADLLGGHTAMEWEACKVGYNYTCLGCGKREPEIKLTADHIKPVAGGRLSGATNNIANIQPLCGKCNSQKGDRHDTDYRIYWNGGMPELPQLDLWGYDPFLIKSEAAG